MVRTKDEGGSALERLRQFGLRYPGAHTKSPWPGHLDLAVNDKTFAYLSIDGDPPKVSCKLPRSADAALELPFTKPTEYGLGKSGWVTATFADDAAVPVELLEEWIDESYRAQAPKRLSAQVPPLGAATQVEGASLPGASVAETGARPPGKRAARTPSPRTPRSTMKRARPSAAVATSGRSAKQGAVKKAVRRVAAVERAAAPSEPKASARAGSKRELARAATPRHAKRNGVSPRAARRPAKKKRAAQRA